LQQILILLAVVFFQQVLIQAASAIFIKCILEAQKMPLRI